MDFVAFGLIIDDIVFPDGQTAMGLLGGGGPQTAFGMTLWADRVGLVAGVGSDLPPEAIAWLKATGVEVRGLRHSTEWPTPRAWQILEADGRRTQVWRTSGLAVGAQLKHRVAQLPPGYQRARGFHVGVHPEAPDLDFIKSLGQLGAVVSLEPFRPAARPLTETELQALLTAGQIFSPNEEEAASLVGPAEPLELIRRLVRAGAELVALRQGRQGATVYRADTGETWHIPAFETSVVDPTGAGNAFCGGFLVGWIQSGDLRLAGLYGAVAASFLVEQVGLPPGGRKSQAAQQRLAELQATTTRLDQ